MREMAYSEAGLAMTKGFEGLRLEAYQDVAGVWTVGYEHTGPKVRAGLRVSEGEADELLRKDLAAAVACVNRAAVVALTQGQFDALVDFCFNAGTGSFVRSTLLRELNAGQYAEAAKQFLVWVHVGGKRCAGLVRRREAERVMFVGNAS